MTDSKSTGTPIRVGLISLGCAKNLVDAEIMLGSLVAEGIEITNDAALADVVIVNTCSFIDAAQEESVDAILESAALREARHRGQGLVVSGCLPQRFTEELPKLLPEVDAFMGIDQVRQIGGIVRQALAHRAERMNSPAKRGSQGKRKVSAQLAAIDAKHPHALDRDHGRPVDGHSPRLASPTAMGAMSGAKGPGLEPLVDVHARPTYIPDYATPRFRLTPPHFAYLKIAEGCNHPCSFCIIPRMRGTHRSRPQGDVLEEARLLLADGVKELNLISQDSTYYGLDLRPNHSRAISSPERFAAAAKDLPPQSTTLCTLLRGLQSLPGDFWVRLLYTHPAHWTDDLIRTIAECPKVARYVDIPLQHCHPTMLEKMRRETTGDYLKELLARIRAGIPGIALRTTFIVGFPGETEEHFEYLLEFMRQMRFERLGIFTYSQEEGTVAGRMSGQVAEEVKAKRRDRAMAVQREIAAATCAAHVGQTLRVLVEGEASFEELRRANVSSWEHGLLRGAENRSDMPRGSYLAARAQADAPDIDGRVYVRGKLPVGHFACVRVVGHTTYDLIAEPLEASR